MTKLPLVEMRDAVLEPFRVMLAARRAFIRRRRHGLRAAKKVQPQPAAAVRPVERALAIGDAVLSVD
jgi:hypothetical protein